MTPPARPERIAHWLGIARQLVLDGPDDPSAWDGLLVAVGESLARAGHAGLGRAVLDDAVLHRDLPGSELSRRETQVAELVARGMTNREVEYSLWPTFVAVPDGWTVTHGPDGRAACLEHIESNWTDMRPKSLVAAMEADAAAHDDGA